MTPNTFAVRITSILNDNGRVALLTDLASGLSTSDRVFVHSSINPIDNTDTLTRITNSDDAAFGYKIYSVEQGKIVLALAWDVIYSYSDVGILSETETIWLSKTVAREGWFYGGVVEGGLYGTENSSTLRFNEPVNVNASPIDFENDLTLDAIRQNTCVFNSGVWLGGDWRMGIWGGAHTITKNDNSIYTYGPSVWLTTDFKFGVWYNGVHWSGDWFDNVYPSQDSDHYNSVWHNGLWKGGDIYDAVWNNGQMTSDWKSSTIHYCHWKGGNSRDVVWLNGRMSDGKFNDMTDILPSKVKSFEESLQWTVELTLPKDVERNYYWVERLTTNDYITVKGINRIIPKLSKIIPNSYRHDLTTELSRVYWRYTSHLVSGNDYVVKLKAYRLNPNLPFSYSGILTTEEFYQNTNVAPIVATKSRIQFGLFEGGEVWFENIKSTIASVSVKSGKDGVSNNTVNRYLEGVMPGENKYRLYVHSGVYAQMPDRGYMYVSKRTEDEIPNLVIGQSDKRSVTLRIQNKVANVPLNYVQLGNTDITDSTSVNLDFNHLFDLVRSAPLVWNGATLINGLWDGYDFLSGTIDVKNYAGYVFDDNTLSTCTASIILNSYVNECKLNKGIVLGGNFFILNNVGGYIDNSGEYGRTTNISNNSNITRIVHLTSGTPNTNTLTEWYKQPIIAGGWIKEHISHNSTYIYGSIQNNEWINGYVLESFDPFISPSHPVYYDGQSRWYFNDLFNTGTSRYGQSISSVNGNTITFLDKHYYQKDYVLFNISTLWNRLNPEEHMTSMKVLAVTDTTITVDKSFAFKDYTSLPIEQRPQLTERIIKGVWRNGVFNHQVETEKIDTSYSGIEKKDLIKSAILLSDWYNGTFIAGTMGGDGKTYKWAKGTWFNGEAYSVYVMSGDFDNIHAGDGTVLTSDGGNLKVTKNLIGKQSDEYHLPVTFRYNTSDKKFTAQIETRNLLAVDSVLNSYLIKYKTGSLFALRGVFNDSKEEILGIDNNLSGKLRFRVSQNYALAVNSGNQEIFVRGKLPTNVIDVSGIFGFQRVTYETSGGNHYLVTNLNTDASILTDYTSSVWIERTKFTKVLEMNRTSSGYSVTFRINDFDVNRDVPSDVYVDTSLVNYNFHINKILNSVSTLRIQKNSGTISIQSKSNLSHIDFVGCENVYGLSMTNCCTLDVNELRIEGEIARSVINKTNVTGGTLKSAYFSGRDVNGLVVNDRSNYFSSVFYKSLNTNDIFNLRLKSISIDPDVRYLNVVAAIDDSYSKGFLDVMGVGDIINIAGFHDMTSVGGPSVGADIPKPHLIVGVINTSTIEINQSTSGLEGPNNNTPPYTQSKNIVTFKILNPYLTSTFTGENRFQYNNFYYEEGSNWSGGGRINTNKIFYNRGIGRISPVAFYGCNYQNTPTQGLYGIVVGGYYNTSSDVIVNSQVYAFGTHLSQIYHEGSVGIIKDLFQPKITFSFPHADLPGLSAVGTYTYIKTNNDSLTGYWKILSYSYSSGNITLELEIPSYVYGTVIQSSTRVERVIYFNKNYQTVGTSGLRLLTNSTNTYSLDGYGDSSKLSIFNIVTSNSIFLHSTITNITNTSMLLWNTNFIYKSTVKGTGTYITRAHWIDSRLERGTWDADESNGILWLSGTMAGGKWLRGTWMSADVLGIYVTMINGQAKMSYDVRSSTWESGIWETGTWRGGKWLGTKKPNRTYSYGNVISVIDPAVGQIYQVVEDSNSVFKAGLWERGIFSGGIFSGIMKSDKLTLAIAGGTYSLTHMVVDQTRFEGGWFKSGHFLAGTIEVDEVSTHLGPSIPLMDVNNDAKFRTVFGSISTGNTFNEYLGIKIKDISNPVTIRRAVIENGYILGCVIDSVSYEKTRPIVVNLGGTYPSGVYAISGEVNSKGRLDISGVKRNSSGTALIDVPGIRSGTFIDVSGTASAGDGFTGIEVGRPILTETKIRVYITGPNTFKFLRGTAPLTGPYVSANFRSLSGSLINKPVVFRQTDNSGNIVTQTSPYLNTRAVPYYKIISSTPDIGGESIYTIDGTFYHTTTPTGPVEITVKMFDVSHNVIRPTTMQKGELINSVWKAGVFEPTDTLNQNLKVRNSIVHVGIVKDTFGSNEQAFEFNKSIWYSGLWENGFSYQSVHNSGYNINWTTSYTNSTDLRTFFAGNQITDTHKVLTPRYFANLLQRWNGINSRTVSTGNARTLFLNANLPTSNVYSDGTFETIPYFNITGALSHDATGGTSIGALYTSTDPDTLVYGRNQGDYAFSAILNDDPYNLVTLVENTRRNYDGRPKIGSNTSTFQRKRFVGSVDNFMSWWKNGKAVGSTWNGGVWSNGGFYSDQVNRKIGLWNRGIWTGGYFGSGLETSDLKPVFMSMRASLEYNHRLPESEMERFSKYGNYSSLIQDPRNRTGYTSYYMAWCIESYQELDTPINTTGETLPLGTDTTNNGRFRENSICSWFGRSTYSGIEDGTYWNNYPSVFNGVFINGIWEDAWKFFASLNPNTILSSPTGPITHLPTTANTLVRFIPHFSRYAEWGNNLSYYDYSVGNVNPDNIQLDLRSNITYQLISRANQLTHDNVTWYLPLHQTNKPYSEFIDSTERAANYDGLVNNKKGTYNFFVPGHRGGRGDARYILYNVPRVNPDVLDMKDLTDTRIYPPDVRKDISFDSITENNWRVAHLTAIDTYKFEVLNNPVNYPPTNTVVNLNRYEISAPTDIFWSTGKPDFTKGEWGIAASPTPNTPYLPTGE